MYHGTIVVLGNSPARMKTIYVQWYHRGVSQLTRKDKDYMYHGTIVVLGNSPARMKVIYVPWYHRGVR